MHCLSGISSRSVSGDRQITAVWKPTFGAAVTRVLLLTLLVLVASKELPGDLNFPLSAVVKKGTFFTVGSEVFAVT